MKCGKVDRGHSFTCEIFKMASRSSAKSELWVKSADFEIGENYQISSKNNGHSFLELRALQDLVEVKIFSRSLRQVLLISAINISVPFLHSIELYIIRISG